jgi:hypothetical protein
MEALLLNWILDLLKGRFASSNDLQLLPRGSSCMSDRTEAIEEGSTEKKSLTEDSPNLDGPV